MTLQAVARICGRWIAVFALAGALTGAMLTTMGLLGGWRAVVITTQSMGGSAPAGTLVAVAPTSADHVVVGDVIVMRRDGAPTVTHRVVDIDRVGDQRVATTRGDANAAADATPFPLDGTQLVRRAQLRHVGWIVHALHQGVVQFAVMVVTTALLAFLALRRIWTAPQRTSPGHIDPTTWGRVPPGRRRSRTKAVA